MAEGCVLCGLGEVEDDEDDNRKDRIRKLVAVG
jgi:hypothetical protein